MTGFNTLAALVIATTVTSTPVASPNTPWIHLDVGLGAPFNVLMAIAFGAFVGVWNQRVEHKGNLLGAFAISFIMTLVAVVGIPRWTSYTWDDVGYQAVMGMGLALTSQTWTPWALDWVKSRFAARSKNNAE